MTWPYSDIDPCENEMREARSWNHRDEVTKSESQLRIFNIELARLMDALSTITQINHRYQLFRLGFEIEDLLTAITNDRLSIQTDQNGEMTKRVQPITVCMEFMQSATNLINVSLNKAQANYQEKLTVAQMRFMQASGELEKNISPTLVDRLRGVVSMFLGSLITVCSFGLASSATAVRGYHLFFGERHKVTSFKDKLLEDTQGVSPAAQRASL
jgi:hypothetical protein